MTCANEKCGKEFERNNSRQIYCCPGCARQVEQRGRYDKYFRSERLHDPLSKVANGDRHQ